MTDFLVSDRVEKPRILAASVAGGALLGVLVVACPDFPRQGFASETPPDILIVVADDLGWRDVDETVPTPNIDGLAAAGVTYRNAYSTPMCSPTRYAGLMGRQPFRDGLGNHIDPRNLEDVSISTDRVSLASALGSVGYKTLFAGKWHLNTRAMQGLREAPRLFGFDACRAATPGNLPPKDGYYSWNRIDDGVESHAEDYSTTAITQATIDWWTDTDGPKFAWVAYHAPHVPLHTPPRELLPDGYTVGPGKRGLFEAMVVALDAELGRLLSHIDTSNTLVFFLGDNGTPWSGIAPDQDVKRVKGSVYEGGINVPFIVTGWRAASGERCDALVSVLDLFATITDAAGYSIPEGIAEDSISFLNTLSSPGLPGKREWLFAQRFIPNGKGPYEHNIRAVVTSTHKLIVAKNGAERLYDLVNDPREQTPLDISSNTVVLRELRERFDEVEALGAP